MSKGAALWPRRKRKKQNEQAEGQTADKQGGDPQGGDTQAHGADPKATKAKEDKPRRRYGWVPPPAKSAPEAEPQSDRSAEEAAGPAAPAQQPAPEPPAEPAPTAGQPGPPREAPEPAPSAQPAPAPAAKASEPAPKGKGTPDKADQQRKSWVARLRDGLGRSSNKLGGGIGSIFTKRKLDAESLEELEELLIASDLGVSTSAKLAGGLKKERFAKDAGPEEVRAALAEDVEEILNPVAHPLEVRTDAKPHIVLVVGVNGSGKTTTIGKLGKQYADQGYKVQFAAGDTFRAAAVEQLQVWGERTGCPVTAKETGADAAGLAYDAVAKAQKDGADLLLIDTAGRLHNKDNLMAELQKVIRVIKKLAPDAPHDVLLVLDATTGQNALSQVETFKQLVNVTGLTVTKLDGSARGGVLVALAEKYGLPVHAVGVGETAEDLRPFSARAFARSLMGLEPDG
jgi:fused signal recognition particle receptor